MKKFTFIVLMVTGVLFYSSLCQASLENIGNQVVLYHATGGQYWYWNLASFSGQTYASQLNNISNLNNGSGSLRSD